MKDLIDIVVERLSMNQPLVMATIVSQSGSTPRTAGTRMLIMPNGGIFGTIGGGRVEAEVIRDAAQRLGSGTARLMSFDLSGQGIDDLDIICGGRLSVMLETIEATPANQTFFQTANALRREGKPATVVTAITQEAQALKVAGRHLILASGSVAGPFPYSDSVLTALIAKIQGRDTAGIQTINDILFLTFPIGLKDIVFIFGAGHVSQQVAALTKMVGFQTVVLDDRPEFANSRRFSGVDNVIVIDRFENVLQDLEINDHSYVIIVTRGHSHDKIVLAQALKTNAAYVGMIGSRRKRDTIYRQLLNERYSQSDIDRVHSPIGLEIGAETPEEIAVSIVAELIRTRAKCKGRLQPGAAA
jgi:xanthine dehydrogenase accessory factor